MKRRSVLMMSAAAAGATVGAGTAGVGTAGAGTVGTGTAGMRARSSSLTGADSEWRGYVADTWHSMAAMTDPSTGLPADSIGTDLDEHSRARYTSPTNIACLLWSVVVARELGLVSVGEARRRISTTLDTLAGLERHPYSGMFYNWYDPRTGAVLRTWPGGDSAVHLFLSSVDNAWLATALMVLCNDDPSLRPRAAAVLAALDFGFFYDPRARGPEVPAGLMRGGFWAEKPPHGGAVRGNYRGRGPDVWYTGHHYGVLNSETRIISYVAIALGQVPAPHYFALWRTFEPDCDWSWQEMKPVGEHRNYLGVPVFEGAYEHRSLRYVPSWGGAMFEALMPDLFVPEARWGPDSWGRNHPAFVRAQIEHGLTEAGYGHWGFSPAADPFGGYREYGVDPMGLDPAGYTSDRERTRFDAGFEGCSGREPQSPPDRYGDGVVTPHAVVLALPYAPDEARAELTRLRSQFDAYGRGGFADSVAVRSGTVARRCLALDQGMIMGALGNLLANDALRRRFADRRVEQAVRPLLAMEEFALPA